MEFERSVIEVEVETFVSKKIEPFKIARTLFWERITGLARVKNMPSKVWRMT